mmetsp:Transcript_42555/g.99889  ORF Transcript_42555/g.99889 Transcript_42555/m.99889 type:complete len:202 (+) Transcript_42555:590-1195(+)
MAHEFASSPRRRWTRVQRRSTRTPPDASRSSQERNCSFDATSAFAMSSIQVGSGFWSRRQDRAWRNRSKASSANRACSVFGSRFARHPSSSFSFSSSSATSSPSSCGLQHHSTSSWNFSVPMSKMFSLLVAFMPASMCFCGKPISTSTSITFWVFSLCFGTADLLDIDIPRRILTASTASWCAIARSDATKVDANDWSSGE